MGADTGHEDMPHLRQLDCGKPSREKERVPGEQDEILPELLPLLDRLVIDGDPSHAPLGVTTDEDDFRRLGEAVGTSGEGHGIGDGEEFARRVDARLQHVAADGDFVGIDLGNGDGDDGAGFLDVLGEGFADFFFEFCGGEADGSHIPQQGHGDGTIGTHFDVGVEFRIFPHANAQSIGHADDVLTSSWVRFLFVGVVGGWRRAGNQRRNQCGEDQ